MSGPTTPPDAGTVREQTLEERIAAIEQKLANAAALLREMSTNAQYTAQDVAWYLAQVLSGNHEEQKEQL
jgi:aconitase B